MSHLLVDLQRPGLTKDGIDRVLRSLPTVGSSNAAGSLPATRTEPTFGSIRVLLNAQDRKRHATLIDPSWRVSSADDFLAEANLSMAGAAASGAALLVLSGATAPSAESLGVMERLLARDPYFAFVTPRFSVDTEEFVTKLDPRCGDPTLPMIPAKAIHSLPEFHLIADQLFAALLIDAKILRDFERLDPGYETLWGALRDLIARARRVGFRCVVSNRARVSLPDDPLPREFASNDLSTIQERFPEVAGLDEEWKHFALHRYESLLGRAFSASSELRKTLLLDLSDMGAIHNGTSEAVVGLLWGLKDCPSDWNISMLVMPEVVEFHEIDRYFPNFRTIWPEPEERFSVVFRPIQPWSLAQIERLHHLALFVFVLMNDTIVNETRVGVVPPGLDKVWGLLAKNADGLFYNSRFTRSRFRIRFPIGEPVDECVCFHAAHPGGYCIRPSQQDGRYIFVVGNSYPHKWMKAAIHDLIEAFPYQPFKALGYEDPDLPQLSGLESGQTGHDAIDRLYAEARMIVFPSQYEGFGFPVIRGLSHGKTVIARQSDLLDELAGNYRGPGRLLAFESNADLVELVARVLHDLDVDPLPLGSALAPQAEPLRQVDIARRILSFIDDHLEKPTSSNWARRQAIFDAAGLYRSTKTE